MLFNTNLEEIIFQGDQTNNSDELIILSGYVGPNPVRKLAELPINSTVIYGMYGDKGIQNRLHNALINIQKSTQNINIYYSTIPIHSKCYIWKKNNQIKYVLIGSANFSTNGLTTPYREILAEITDDTFQPLNEYIQKVMKNTQICTDIKLKEDIKVDKQKREISLICKVSFLGRGEKLYSSSGLNWGHGKGHVTPNDAYISIKKEYIRACPSLFPPKQEFPSVQHGGRLQRHNDIIEIIWDDGTVMDGLLEGNQNENGLIYPKQISSASKKSLMGRYIRDRIGVASGVLITIEDLEKYGRTDIEITLLDKGIYYFDFSVK